MPYERYEATTGGTHKFWEITWLEGGTRFEVFWGFVGQATAVPLCRTYSFGGPRQAKIARDHEVRSRLRQGFSRVFHKPGIKPGSTVGISPTPIAAKPKGDKTAALVIDEHTSEQQTASKPKKYGRRQRRLRF